MKVCHMTSAHPKEDSRIFFKECVSLANAGHEVYLVGKGDSYEKHGVHMIGVGEESRGRFDRMFRFSRVVCQAAIGLDCDIYHFHDPELLPYCLKLKRAGKTVVFDSHEDVPAVIMSREWIPKPLRYLVSRVYRALETIIVRKLDAVVAATPHIERQFQGRTGKTATVRNYPPLRTSGEPLEHHKRTLQLGYTGVRISPDRGAAQMVKAASAAKARLDAYGTVKPAELKQELEQMDPDGYVTFHGLAPFEELQQQMENMKIGLLVEHPTQNGVNALCIKMFEYMLHGMALIVSDFPLWREIVTEADCGVCVDPFDVDAISRAITELLADEKRTAQMGMNGYRAVLDRYNWKAEEKKLLSLYGSFGK